RIDVLRAVQHEHPRQRLLRRQRDVSGRPTELLQVAGAVSHLDRPKLSDAANGAHRLNPTAVESRSDAIDLVKSIVAILLRPQSAAQRIEVHTKTIANAVRENLLDV